MLGAAQGRIRAAMPTDNPWLPGRGIEFPRRSLEPTPHLEQRTPAPVRIWVAHCWVTPQAFVEEELCICAWGQRKDENPAVLCGNGNPFDQKHYQTTRKLYLYT